MKTNSIVANIKMAVFSQLPEIKKTKKKFQNLEKIFGN